MHACERGELTSLSLEDFFTFIFIIFPDIALRVSSVCCMSDDSRSAQSLTHSAGAAVMSLVLLLVFPCTALHQPHSESVQCVVCVGSGGRALTGQARECKHTASCIVCSPSCDDVVAFVSHPLYNNVNLIMNCQNQAVSGANFEGS